MSSESHCLHPLLPTQRNNKLLNSLRNLGHNYTYSHKLSQHYSRTVSFTGVCFLIVSVLRVLQLVFSLLLIMYLLFSPCIGQHTVVMCAFDTY